MARVLLGVCGGIAAYKAAALVSALVQRGDRVDVIMSESATHFVGPLTFAALSRNPMGRMGESAEIAGVIVFLLSPLAGYVNGALVVADGGWSIAP